MNLPGLGELTNISGSCYSSLFEAGRGMASPLHIPYQAVAAKKSDGCNCCVARLIDRILHSGNQINGFSIPERLNWSAYFRSAIRSISGELNRV